MFELGTYEEDGHRKVGFRAAEIVDQLITLGDLGKMISAAAREAGLAKQFVSALDTSDEVIALLKTILREGDVVLIKGSHSLRMDQIVHALEVEE
jgi:UDP-N-acetylmuramoyl-tripeptide--D-alanyl-D-alanine ligase